MNDQNSRKPIGRAAQIPVKLSALGLTLVISMAFAPPSCAAETLTGYWVGSDDLKINFDNRRIILGPDGGCEIASVKSIGSNLWKILGKCGISDIPRVLELKGTLQLRGSTLFLTTSDGTYPLKRAPEPSAKQAPIAVPSIKLVRDMQCVQVRAQRPREEDSTWTQSVYPLVLTKLDACGCPSQQIDYVVRTGAPRKDLTRGTLDTHDNYQFMLRLSADANVVRESGIELDLNCATPK
ncbi:DUF2195 family protein [Affinibrenneria salicis]|nr:DUF2195 family protein [Affinibrenneria salicis]